MQLDRMVFWGILLFLLSTCTQVEQEKEPQVSPVGEPQSPVTDLQQRSPATEYWLEWGKILIPLERYANPNVYRGEVWVELEDFTADVGQQLRLFYKNKELPLEINSFSRPPFYRGSPWWFSYPTERQGVLKPDLLAKIREGAAAGDEWHLHIYSEPDDLRGHSVIIRLVNPNAGYLPKVRVPRRFPAGEAYGFQIINLSNRPPLLRIDTNAQASRHVLELYRENKQYRILHVPDFATKRRLLTDRDYLFGVADIKRTVLFDDLPDWLTLTEYTQFEDSISLSWGAMRAAPESETYSRTFFQEQIGKPIVLKVGTRNLIIEGFHLITTSERIAPQLYVTTRLSTPGLWRELVQLPPGSSLYFDQLIVRDETGRRYLFPVPFAFIIGREPMEMAPDS